MGTLERLQSGATFDLLLLELSSGDGDSLRAALAAMGTSGCADYFDLSAR